MSIGLTLYAFWAKNTDFTLLAGLAFCCLMVLIPASILSIFFYSRWLEIVISGKFFVGEICLKGNSLWSYFDERLSDYRHADDSRRPLFEV
jgi:hypothetical protein